jgi:hypothetical protein
LNLQKPKRAKRQPDTRFRKGSTVCCPEPFGKPQDKLREGSAFPLHEKQMLRRSRYFVSSMTKWRMNSGKLH